MREKKYIQPGERVNVLQIRCKFDNLEKVLSSGISSFCAVRESYLIEGFTPSFPTIWTVEVVDVVVVVVWLEIRRECSIYTPADGLYKIKTNQSKQENKFSWSRTMMLRPIIVGVVLIATVTVAVEVDVNPLKEVDGVFRKSLICILSIDHPRSEEISIHVFVVFTFIYLLLSLWSNIDSISDCDVNKPLETYLNGSTAIAKYMKETKMFEIAAKLFAELRAVGVQMQNRVVTT